jgi:uncharacterized phage-associated protein
MDPRRATLEDAITAVAAQAEGHGVALTRTKLVKLLYFVDLAAWESFGRTVTGVEWIWHHYGPYSSSIVEAVESMGSNDELELTESMNYFGSPEYRLRSISPAYYRPASSDLMGLARSVLRRYGNMSPSAIGDASYETAPMRDLITRGGSRGDRLEFNSPSPTRRDVSATLDRYRPRLSSEPEHGEIVAGLRSELDQLDTARRAANTALLPHP